MVEERIINVEIKGAPDSPLLMSRLYLGEPRGKNAPEMKPYMCANCGPNDPEELAWRAAYIDVIDGAEQLYIPAFAVHSMLVWEARSWRFAGDRRRTRGVGDLVEATIRIGPEKIGIGHCNYEPYSVHATIAPSGTPKIRAKVMEWNAKFRITYDEGAWKSPKMTAEVLREMLEDAGTKIGLFDFRPQHKGWFGKFTVEKFEIAK